MKTDRRNADRRNGRNQSSGPAAQEYRDRRRFRILVVMAFMTIFLFNLLTPMLTDDFSYGAQVREASSFLDLVRQEYRQYMTWNGRSVVHLLLRCFLSLPPLVFKLCNSLVFVALTLLVYVNIRGRKHWSPVLYLGAVLMLWFTGVDFAQTVLWETGACNYLWGTTIILGFMTLVRHIACGGGDRRGEETEDAAGPPRGGKTPAAQAGSGLHGIQGGNPAAEADSGLRDIAGGKPAAKEAGSGLHGIPGGNPAAKALGVVFLFLFGVLAGWCNENTSGGALLFVLILLGREARSGRPSAEEDAADRKKRLSYLIAAALGNAFGLYMMVSAPGNALRAQYRTEEHSGLFGMLSRFQKVTLRVEKYFFFLLVLLIITIVISVLQHREREAAPTGKASRSAVLSGVLSARLFFAFLFLATAYALILTAQTQPRAFFGAGVFLIIACLQGLEDIVRDEKLAEAQRPGRHDGGFGVRAAVWSLLAAAALFFCLMYLDNGANMARVWRDSRERISYILEQKAAGAEGVIRVGQLHADFKNKFTAAYEGDLTEDPGYWTNVAMADYFQVDGLSAVSYDDWAVSVGRETPEEAAQNNYDEVEENGLFGF